MITNATKLALKAGIIVNIMLDFGGKQVQCITFNQWILTVKQKPNDNCIYNHEYNI